MKFETVKLGDFVTITMGQSPKSEFYNTNGDGIPFLQGNRTFGLKYPNFDTYTTKVTKEAKAGDIIMSVRAPVGDLNITPINMCLGRGVCSLRANNNNQDFLFYLMKYYMPLLLNKESGTVFGSVNKNDINNLEINLPPLETQKKIASILSALDDKIELNNKINENLEMQAQAIYQNMIIKNASDNWICGKLSDIAVITMGQSPKGDTYNENGVGTVFYQGRAEFSFRFPTRRLFTTEPKRMAEENDVLMSVRAPVGDLNISTESCCIGRGLAAIHSKNSHQSFVLYTMYAVQEQLNIFNGEGTVFGSINKDSLYNIDVVIPDKETLDKFESIVAPMDAIIRNNYDQNCKLQSIRDTLLPKLMNGEIDVDDVQVKE